MKLQQLEKQVAKLKQEKTALEKKLTRRDKTTKEMQRSGPDADLLRANIELSDEVKYLKEDLALMKNKIREEAF